MVRKAFKQARTERPGATFLILPEDVAEQTTDRRPLRVNVPVDPAPSEAQVARAAQLLGEAERAVVLAGPGVARDQAMEALVRFSEALNLPVATTFLGKGVFPDDHPNALGTIGFMVRDYANFGFDEADVVVAVGYDLVEYAPERWNPNRTSGSCTSTGPSPRSTTRTSSRSACRATSASRWMRRGRRRRSCRAAIASSRGSGTCARSSRRARPTTRSRSGRSGSSTTSARRSTGRTSSCATPGA